MIFISSSCIRSNHIKDSILQLVEMGFKNIELSGGTQYYDLFVDDLLFLKEQYNLNYRCHNYFPPPLKPFVLNLASLDNNIHNLSIEHLKKAIRLSHHLSSTKFGFHAGFYINISHNEIGKKISHQDLYNIDECIKLFCTSFDELKKLSKNVELYIENNVLSYSNYKNFNNQNPFMLTTSEEMISLRKHINFELLLDIAHLKVSSKTLGLNFEDEFSVMFEQSKYIHVSDNDGLHDLNHPLEKDSRLVDLIKNSDSFNKDFTLEVYSTKDDIIRSYEILEEAIR